MQSGVLRCIGAQSAGSARLHMQARCSRCIHMRMQAIHCTLHVRAADSVRAQARVWRAAVPRMQACRACSARRGACSEAHAWPRMQRTCSRQSTRADTRTHARAQVRMIVLLHAYNLGFSAWQVRQRHALKCLHANTRAHACDPNACLNA